MSRRICAVTTTRADYGLLYWTLRGISDDPDLTLQLAVTGTHLSPAHGHTLDIIQADGLPVAATIDMRLADDSAVATGHALARAMAGFSDALDRLKPDLLLVLGDRYEILAAVQAAMLQRIPIAHIHGGESTEGLIDEAVRHAVTKMSHIHCVSALPHALRVRQMGERPDHVHVVGAPGLDAIRHLEPMTREELEASLDLELGDTNVLLTLHPETLSQASAMEQVAPLLDALEGYPEARVVITGSNADPSGRQISQLLQAHAAAHPERFRYYETLGQKRYLNLLKTVDLVIGNSSSGIIEAPALGTPVVNIGERQRRRLRAPAVIDCAADVAAIREAIDTALSPRHRRLASCKETPYGEPGAAEKIVRILRDTPLDGIMKKSFHDLEARP